MLGLTDLKIVVINGVTKAMAIHNSLRWQWSSRSENPWRQPSTTHLPRSEAKAGSWYEYIWSRGGQHIFVGDLKPRRLARRHSSRYEKPRGCPYWNNSRCGRKFLWRWCSQIKHIFEVKPHRGALKRQINNRSLCRASKMRQGGCK